MNRIKYLIPNIFTSLSLLSALIAIYFISLNEFILPSWLILFSMICDFCDGKSARMLKATSPFGTQYDLMSDFVAFGIAPAFLAYQLSLGQVPYLGAVVTVLYVFSGCYRLIRFALQGKEHHNKPSFIGLPIPAAAGLISSLVIFNLGRWNQIPDNFFFMIIVFVISLLMSSRIEYLKIESFDKNGKELKYFLLVFVISLIFTFWHLYLVILLWFITYIVFCPIRYFIMLFLNKEARLNNMDRL